MHARVALLLICLLLAGCAGAPESKPAPKPEQEAFVQDLLHLEECRGVSLAQAYLPGTNPAPVPDGWAETDGPRSHVSLWLWECPGVGLDHLERPATLLWETTDVAQAPGGCFSDDGHAPALVLSVLTDDELLRERLATRGLPVELASFQHATSPTGFRWTWNTGETSSLDVVWRPAPFPDERVGAGRWAWVTQDGVGWLDLESVGTLEDFVPSAGQGTFASPHYVGIERRYVGPVLVSEDESLFATFDNGGPSCD